MLCLPLAALRRHGLRSFVCAVLALSTAAQNNLDAGDVAIIGWRDTGGGAPAFTVAFLADVAAGTDVYFTNNGITGSVFRNTQNDGDGDEQLLRFSTLQPIPAGTIVSSTDVGAAFAWTSSGAIPGAASGSFSTLNLSATGDQIVAFQHDTGLDPLNAPTARMLFELDDTGAYENALDVHTSAVAPGLSALAHTSLTFFQLGAGQDSMAFHTNALALGTKADWLTALANAANWTFGSGVPLPAGTIAVHACPTILTQRTNQSVCPGANATFSVQAVGSAPLSYAWFRNGNPLIDSGPVTGSHSPTLHISSVAVFYAGAFHVVVSNSCGSVASTPGLLIIDPTDSDNDGTPNCSDQCPLDPAKIAPGQCGCGVIDTDADGDGVADCNDGCPNDFHKTQPGACGCGIADTDTDLDGTADCNDLCPSDPAKTTPGQCGCGSPDTDGDGDGVANCIDNCAAIANADQADTDGDGHGNACDNCVDVANPTQANGDGDALGDACDGCPTDANKTAPGVCGCGVADTDGDGDGVVNCIDNCPAIANADQADMDGDGHGNLCDNCVAVANPGQENTDNDALGNACDGCPVDPNKTAPGLCGCGISDADSDSDGIADCNDNCPNLPNPIQADFDGDGVGNGCDNCGGIANPSQTDCDADGVGDICQLASGALDCNFNGMLDSCEIASGAQADVNHNGIPDACELVGGVPYCYGDGMAPFPPCPCGNQVAPGSGTGCRNSTGAGARLVGTGLQSVSADQLVLTVSGLQVSFHVGCLFFQGDVQINQGFGAPFNDGLVCAGGSVLRIGVKLADNGTVTYPEAGDPPISVPGLVPAIGGVRYYQCWYRDLLGPCATLTNISNGVQVIWQP